MKHSVIHERDFSSDIADPLPKSIDSPLVAAKINVSQGLTLRNKFTATRNTRWLLEIISLETDVQLTQTFTFPLRPKREEGRRRKQQRERMSPTMFTERCTSNLSRRSCASGRSGRHTTIPCMGCLLRCSRSAPLRMWRRRSSSTMRQRRRSWGQTASEADTHWTKTSQTAVAAVAVGWSRSTMSRRARGRCRSWASRPCAAGFLGSRRSTC
jgi:hypothetical protein